MKRSRKLLLALAVFVPLALFIVARQAASWRLQPITQAEFQARLAPQPPYVDFDSDGQGKAPALTTAQRQLKQRANAKGWQPRSLSSDGKLLLAEKEATESVAILKAVDASVAVKLQTKKNARPGEMSAGEFSSDGRLVAFSRFEISATQVFDAQTGQRLWEGEYWGEKFVFSPDGKLAALPDVNQTMLTVRDARSGRELKRLPTRNFTENWGFSRDSDALLVEIAPGEFRRLRLR